MPYANQTLTANEHKDALEPVDASPITTGATGVDAIGSPAVESNAAPQQPLQEICLINDSPESQQDNITLAQASPFAHGKTASKSLFENLPVTERTEATSDTVASDKGTLPRDEELTQTLSPYNAPLKAQPAQPATAQNAAEHTSTTHLSDSLHGSNNEQYLVTPPEAQSVAVNNIQPEQQQPAFKMQEETVTSVVSQLEPSALNNAVTLTPSLDQTSETVLTTVSGDSQLNESFNPAQHLPFTEKYDSRMKHLDRDTCPAKMFEAVTTSTKPPVVIVSKLSDTSFKGGQAFNTSTEALSLIDGTGHSPTGMSIEQAMKMLNLNNIREMTESVIRKAYREFSRTAHPDWGFNDDGIYLGGEAKSVLIDSLKEPKPEETLLLTDAIEKTENKTTFTPNPKYISTSENTRIASYEDGKRKSKEDKLKKEKAETFDEKKQEPVYETPKAEPAPVISQNSVAGAQVKSLYAAGISEMQTSMSTTAMNRHSSMMGSIHSGGMLRGVAELEDVSTGEMLASTSNILTSQPDRIKTGNVYSYGQVYGLKVNQGSVNSLPGFDANGYGLEVGVFRQMTNDWSLGVMMGLQRMNTSFSENAGSMKADSYRFGPFASWNNEAWHFNTALTYGWSDLKGNRRDPMTGENRTSNPRVKEWNAYASLGYDINLDNVTTGLVMTPNAELLYINSTQDGFKEKGDGNNLIQVESQSRQDWIARTGIQVSYLIPDYEHPQEVRAGVGYQRNFMDNSEIKAGYNSGSMQQLKTSSYGNSSAYYNLGYPMMINNDQNLHFDYFGSTGNSSQSHALALTYEMKF